MPGVKKVTRWPQDSGSFGSLRQRRSPKKELDSRLRGNDEPTKELAPRLRGNDEREEQELDYARAARVPYGPFAARMFASASPTQSRLRRNDKQGKSGSPSGAGMTRKNIAA